MAGIEGGSMERVEGCGASLSLNYGREGGAVHDARRDDDGDDARQRGPAGCGWRWCAAFDLGGAALSAVDDDDGDDETMTRGYLSASSKALDTTRTQIAPRQVKPVFVSVCACI